MGIGMAIEALRKKIVEDINGAGLPPVVVELVMQPIMEELHGMALGQIQAEETEAKRKQGEQDAGTGTENE